ncbi:MAG: type II CRISPR RNA-guided endonuclease Cas9 [Verrucomicrobiota bacterium]
MANRNADLELSFDVGHSSIGWAVLQTNPSLEIKGCGAVIFRADDCLASKRRDFRRQRRHIRSTRQRIKRMKLLLVHMGVLTQKQLDTPGCGWPWKLAARVLVGGQPLTWPELWDVLRWYAHNRGYDGNRRWSGQNDEETEDAEKVQNAYTLLDKHGVKTMAETFCKVLEVDPLGAKSSSIVRFKGLNAAFPRGIVEGEVTRILQAHFGKLKGVDEKFVTALFSDWKTLPCPAIKLPQRYYGGLLFGQLVPRFDNRIISKCPVTGEKVPSRNTPEFLNFRWGMVLANIQVARLGNTGLQPLTPAERKELDKRMRAVGSMTAIQFKKAVRDVTTALRDNLDTMLMHPDAHEALILDHVQKELTTGHAAVLFPTLPERIQKRTRGQLRRGKTLILGELGKDVPAFAAAVQQILDKGAGKGRKKDKVLTRDEILGARLQATRLSGRAAFARPILVKSFQEVMAGNHPKEENGCLFVTEKMREAQLNRSLSDQTNNHLVQHRLLILGRLLSDMLNEYAGGDKARVGKLTIEVNRDLREFSGKTAKEIAQDLGSRLANHHHVAEKLEAALDSRTRITAGLIRKARIAEDLGWTCPYTGQTYEPIDLVTRRVDKDHIVPRADRTSDSLDSLVITFSAVNKWKGKRTAVQFMQDEQTKPVPDLPNLSVMSLTRYRDFVNGLDIRRGHNDDQKRKKRRKELMLIANYDEPEFTPRDLTVTSQLVRLGAQVLRNAFDDCEDKPVIVLLPGSVTGEVRKAWDVLGCLSAACPQVLDETGKVKTKKEVRDLTHLHHALDACVLGLAAHHIPNNGRVWELITKRNLTTAELAELVKLKVFSVVGERRAELNDLSRERKEQIRQRLAEKRVVQHIPKRVSGLHVEQNTWRVREINGDAVLLEQRIRQPDGTRPLKQASERAGKLMGLEPGKLHALQGALVIGDNFGVALDPTPTVIPFHKVWPRLQELKAKNGGKMPRVLRNGQLIRVSQGSRAGLWRITSIKQTEAYGLALDLAYPDNVGLSRPNAPIEQLQKDGLEIIAASLTGFDSSSVVYTPVKVRPRKDKKIEAKS